MKSALLATLLFAAAAHAQPAVTLTHIHGPAQRGVAAAPIISLPNSGTTTGNFNVGPLAITPTQAAPLAAPVQATRIPAAVIPIESARSRMGQAELRQAFSALASSSNLAG